ncbi:YraN family protein [Desulfosarcina sp. OttesenSCG-928-A07]|nr:YraN family protein [Desulfosarcina sp. OttesenSCG-928-G17]MDL2329354.1 YraN family protein [Desulfosarcina sp. OttesenSCG-928-A07]
MRTPRQQFGTASEALAASHLRQLGYRILETNYRTRQGEVDIIAEDAEVLVFVEVKARGSFRFGSPKAAVTPTKQRKIALAGLFYMKASGKMGSRIRFDVVAIDTTSGKPEIEVVKNAFQPVFG